MMVLALLLCGLVLAEETDMRYDFSVFTKELCINYIVVLGKME